MSHPTNIQALIPDEFLERVRNAAPMTEEDIDNLVERYNQVKRDEAASPEYRLQVVEAGVSVLLHNMSLLANRVYTLEEAHHG